MHRSGVRPSVRVFECVWITTYCIILCTFVLFFFLLNLLTILFVYVHILVFYALSLSLA